MEAFCNNTYAIDLLYANNGGYLSGTNFYKPFFNWACVKMKPSEKTWLFFFIPKNGLLFAMYS